jgi:hypothetical protein
MGESGDSRGYTTTHQYLRRKSGIFFKEISQIMGRFAPQVFHIE